MTLPRAQAVARIATVEIDDFVRIAQDINTAWLTFPNLDIKIEKNEKSGVQAPTLDLDNTWRMTSRRSSDDRCTDEIAWILPNDDFRGPFWPNYDIETKPISCLL